MLEARPFGASVLAVLLLLLASARQAHAEPKRFSLNWVREPGAESCIASHALAKIIEQSLGPVFVEPADAELAIEGRIRALVHARGFAARIAVSDRTGRMLGERQLTSASTDCRALDPQIALVIVLAIDPEVALDRLPVELLQPLQTAGDPAAELLAELQAETRAKAAEALPPAAPAPRLVEAPVEAAASAPKPPPAEPSPPAPQPAPRYAFALGVALGAGMLPNPSLGPALAIAVRLGQPFSVALHATYWPANDAALAAPSAPGDVVHFQMASGALLGCAAAWAAATAELRACAGFALGARFSDGAALAKPNDVTRWNFGPTLANELALEFLPPVFAALAAAAELPLLREEFTYRDARGQERALFAPWRVSLAGRLAVGVLFYVSLGNSLPERQHTGRA